MQHWRYTIGSGPRESPWLSSHDTQRFPGQTKTAAPVRGRAVSGPWYHPTSQPRTGRLPCSPVARGKCHWGDPVTGVCPPPPTAPSGGSGRSSEVFFAGVPGSALQLPRFSGPFPPDTRPRQCFALLLCLVTLTAGYRSVNTPPPRLASTPCGQQLQLWQIQTCQPNRS